MPSASGIPGVPSSRKLAGSTASGDGAAVALGAALGELDEAASDGGAGATGVHPASRKAAAITATCGRIRLTRSSYGQNPQLAEV